MMPVVFLTPTSSLKSCKISQCKEKPQLLEILLYSVKKESSNTQRNSYNYIILAHYKHSCLRCSATSLTKTLCDFPASPVLPAMRCSQVTRWLSAITATDMELFLRNCHNCCLLCCIAWVFLRRWLRSAYAHAPPQFCHLCVLSCAC